MDKSTKMPGYLLNTKLYLDLEPFASCQLAIIICFYPKPTNMKQLCLKKIQIMKDKINPYTGWLLKNLLRLYLVFLISWSDYIRSSKFFSLPPIIIGVL